MLNIAIKSRETFNQLVVSIVEELSGMINELNELNKVGDIKSELEKMYKTLRQESCSTLLQVKQYFKQHEEDFRTKLCSYVRLIKESLKTLAQGDDSKIGELKNKIKALVGEKNGCGNRNGKLVELENKIKTANSKYNYYGTVNFMKTGDPLGHDNFRKVLNVEEKVRQFTGLANDNLQSIYKTQLMLCGILGTLNENTEFGRIIKEIDELTKENINTYEGKIRGHETKVQLLNTLSVQIEPYRKSLEGTVNGQRKEKGLKDVTKAVKELKESVRTNQEHLDETFVKEVTSITDITDQELDEITKGLEDIIDTVKTTQNFITNTKLFFRYLNVFKEHKSKIDKLKIEGDNISEIQETISSLEVAISTIEETISPIHKAKQNLDDYNQTWNVQKREDAMPGIKLLYFPKDLNVLDDWGEIQGFKTKLEAIQSLNEIVPENFMSSFMFLIEPTTETSIDKLFSSLVQIECWLEKSGYISHDIQKMLASYESTKSNLSVNHNGNDIERMVQSLGQIPEMLSKLHNTVKIYIQLTQIVSNVVRTLDEMKPKAGKLKETNNIVGNLRNNVESAITELKDVYLNTVYMPNIGEKMRMYNINFATKKLKEYLKNLEGDVRSIRKIEKNLANSMSEIQKYQEILRDIYREITYKTSQLIDLVYGTRSNGSIANALSGANNERIQRSKEIIKQLRGIQIKIIKLMKYLCEVQYSNCCTKRKLGCFVKSVETRTRWIGEGVRELESSIENVIVCFLKCLKKHTKYIYKYRFFIEINHIEQF